MRLEEFEGRAGRPADKIHVKSPYMYDLVLRHSYHDSLFFSPDPRRPAGKVVHLDWELLQMVDTCIQLGHQHEEVRSLVIMMFCFDNTKFILIAL